MSASGPVLLSTAGLVAGRVLRRYQRFLADVRLADGSTVVAHCPNTGTMESCWAPDDPVLLAPNDNPRRKLRYTWIACERDGHWVGVDTGVPNRVVAEAARRDRLPGLAGLGDVRTEVPYGRERSRIDVLATDRAGRRVYIEVKNTTLRVDTGSGPVICFPDAVTARGVKHMRELQGVVAEGHRAAVVFFVHRGDGVAFDAARGIDPGYAEELDRAADAGVAVLPVQARMQLRPQEGGRWTLRWTIDGLLRWAARSPGS